MLCYHYGVDRLRHGGYVISRAQFDPFYTSRLHPYLACATFQIHHRLRVIWSRKAGPGSSAAGSDRGP
jgi:hypothetical protein